MVKIAFVCRHWCFGHLVSSLMYDGIPMLFKFPAVSPISAPNSRWTQDEGKAPLCSTLWGMAFLKIVGLLCWSQAHRSRLVEHWKSVVLCLLPKLELILVPKTREESLNWCLKLGNSLWTDTKSVGNCLETFSEGSMKEHIMYLDFPVYSVLNSFSHFSYQSTDQSIYYPFSLLYQSCTSTFCCATQNWNEIFSWRAILSGTSVRLTPRTAWGTLGFNTQ